MKNVSLIPYGSSSSVGVLWVKENPRVCWQRDSSMLRVSKFHYIFFGLIFLFVIFYGLIEIDNNIKYEFLINFETMARIRSDKHTLETILKMSKMSFLEALIDKNNLN